MSSLSEQSTGRWRDLLSTILELDAEVLDGKHHSCPVCGGTDRFRFDDLEGRGTYHCNQCGAGNGLMLICRVKKIKPSEAWELVKESLPTAQCVQPKKKKDYRPLIKQVLASSHPVASGDAVHQYLASRGIKNPPPTILVAPSLYPAHTDPQMMVCRIGREGKLVGIHVTLLRDGKRLDRLIYGLDKDSIIGGAIYLYPRNATGKLIAGEGIETSLSARLLFGERPTWACLNAQLLSQVTIPEGVNDLLIAGDNDSSYTGQKAAYTLANRSVVIEKRKATVVFPEEVDTDWNDVLLKHPDYVMLHST